MPPKESKDISVSDGLPKITTTAQFNRSVQPERRSGWVSGRDRSRAFRGRFLHQERDRREAGPRGEAWDSLHARWTPGERVWDLDE